MEFLELVHLMVGCKVTDASGVHALPDGCSLVIGKTINAGTARLYLARYSREFLLIFFRPGLDLLQQ